jgi:hypothetical protein
MDRKIHCNFIAASTIVQNALMIEYMFQYNPNHGYSAKEKIFTDRLQKDEQILPHPGFPNFS